MTEPFLEPPQIISEPGDAYSDAYRMFQGIPGIARTNTGQLWACWYGGGITEDRHNYVMLARSSGDGRLWSRVYLVIDPDGEGPTRAFDPCLWTDPAGRLWLFWAQGYERQTDGWSGVWAMSTVEPDGAHPVWSDPNRLSDGIMMNKPTVLQTGEWLLPVASWFAEGSASVYSSRDGGLSQSLIGRANIPAKEDRNCDEHQIMELRDGSLWMWVRTIYGIGESRSLDRGRTWTEIAPSTVQHATSRFHCRRLLSGNLLLVKHGPLDERTGRSHLTAYFSRDDGASWLGGLLLDEREGVSYPDSVDTDDGTIFVIYDFDRRGAREILLARFNEKDIESGTIGPAGAFRILVNKAGKEKQ
jgi:predicted neuraminidase